jgi:hypothetical protein
VNPRKFFAELKRRNVYKVAIAEPNETELSHRWGRRAWLPCKTVS